MPVDITGVQGTLKLMSDFDDVLYAQMNKQIKKVMLPIRNKARSYAPANSKMLSGWTKAGSSDETITYRAFPKYDENEVRDGIVYRQGGNKPNRNGFQVVNYIANNSPGGAIYETAGRKNANGQPSQESTRGIYSDYIDTSNKVNKSLNPNAGKQFIARANATGKLVNARPRQAGQRGRVSRMSTGRLIYRAWAEDQGNAYDAVNLAISSAVKKFNATPTNGRNRLAA